MSTILIVGAGSIGAFFGAALARQGAQVAVVCRSDYDIVAAQGFKIRSGLLGDHVFRPHQVLRQVSDCTEPPDYLILATKVLPALDRVALIRPAVGPKTTLVLIQNGIDIETEIARAFPDNEVISGIAMIGVGRSAPGEVNHQTAGSLRLGRYPQGVSAAVEQLAYQFSEGGVPCSVTDNVVGARWQKTLWNASFNPVSIMGGVLDTANMLGNAEAREFVRQTMQEIAAVATTAGHAPPAGLIDQLIEVTAAMPPYKTSMAQDYEAGRAMEIEAILGNPLRIARELRVATPILESLYALAKMIESKSASSA